MIVVIVGPVLGGCRGFPASISGNDITEVFSLALIRMVLRDVDSNIGPV